MTNFVLTTDNKCSYVLLSAKAQNGILELKSLLEKSQSSLLQQNADATFVTNIRHYEALVKASKSLSSALSAIGQKVDLGSLDLGSAVVGKKGGIEADSPTLKSWKVEGDRFILSFDHARRFYVYNPDRSLSNGFEIAGEDGKFVPAKIVNAHSEKRGKNVVCNGVLDGDRIILSAEGVKAPRKLRYLHSAPWFGSIYNEVNLPLGAFHIGD